MTRSLVAFSRWSLTPGTLLLETIRASDCGRPRRVVAQTRGRPRQVLLYCHRWTQVTSYMYLKWELLSGRGINLKTLLRAIQCYIWPTLYRGAAHAQLQNLCCPDLMPLRCGYSSPPLIRIHPYKAPYKATEHYAAAFGVH